MQELKGLLRSQFPSGWISVLIFGGAIALLMHAMSASAHAEARDINEYSGEIPLNSSIAINGHSIAAGLRGLERGIRQSSGIRPMKFHEMTGPYASLQWRWENREGLPTHDGGKTTPEAFDEGGYGALITTAANNGAGPYPGGSIVRPEWSGPYAVKFFDLFFESNPGSRGYILTFWNNRLDHPDSNSSDWEFDTPEQWRSRIEEDMLVWDGILDYVNANKSSSEDVRLIRYLDLYALIYDNLAGAPEGANEIFDWFIDNVHPSDRGRWAGAALIAYQLFGIDPEDVPLRVGAVSHGYARVSASVSALERDFLAPLITEVVDRNR